MSAQLPPNIFFEDKTFQNLRTFLKKRKFSSVFILADENTRKHCYPKIKSVLPNHQVIQVKAGEKNKNLSTCELIWKKLTAANADRNSLLVNLGGGVIGDLGGFAAGCYKRGMKFINVPTSLLAMVDASVGAKTGIDFSNFKNQIGLFNEPESVFVHTPFLKTLSEKELRNGMAEVVKHYLIADAALAKFIFDFGRGKKKDRFNEVKDLNWDELVRKNIAIKYSFVKSDLKEKGIRKSLNFGHTIAHALEKYFLEKGKPISHGQAVAAGILTEAHISLSSSLSRNQYPLVIFLVCWAVEDIPKLHKQAIPKVIAYIAQDKKNSSGKNQFTLLKKIGSCSINNFVDEKTIAHSLSYYCEIS